MSKSWDEKADDEFDKCLDKYLDEVVQNPESIYTYALPEEIEKAIAELEFLFGPFRNPSFAPEWEIVKRAALDWANFKRKVGGNDD